MIYLLGGAGFVGSAYARLFDELGLSYRAVTRENYDEYRGIDCDLLINANGNSKKFLATRDPLNEFDQSVRSVAESIESFKCKTYVYLSTGDVYPKQDSPEVTGEDQAINSACQSRYGLHKRLAEMLVQGTQPNWLIIRMGGFVGPGLKKNAVFDMLTGAPVWLSPASELQFISTDRAARLVWRLIEKSITREIVNLGSTGLVNLGQLHRRLRSSSEFRPDAPTIRYELSVAKLASLTGEPLPDSITEVEAFIATAGKKAVAAVNS